MIIFFSRLQSLPLFQSFFFFRWAPTPVDAVEGGGRQGAWPRSARWWKEEWAWPQSDRCWSRNKRSGSIYKLLPRGQKPDLGLCPDQLETHPFPHLFTDSPNQPPAAAKRDKGFKELFVLLLLLLFGKKTPTLTRFSFVFWINQDSEISDFINWNWQNCPQRMPNNQSQRSRPVLRYTTVAIWIFHTPSFICPRSKTTEKTNLMEFKVIEGHF